MAQRLGGLAWEVNDFRCGFCDRRQNPRLYSEVIADEQQIIFVENRMRYDIAATILILEVHQGIWCGQYVVQLL